MGLYSSHPEQDDVPFSIAVWPLEDLNRGGDRALVGSGDVYFHLDDGRNRRGRFLAEPLRELRREEAGLEGWFEDRVDELEAEDEASRWWLVGNGATVALWFGVLVKPGKVPAELPAELESAQATGSGGRPHPRSVVGVRLALAAEDRLAPFDPADARVVAATRSLEQWLPKEKNVGFVVLPSDARPAAAPTPGRADPASVPPDEAPWIEALAHAHGPLESDGETYFGGRLKGVVVRVSEARSDALDAWYQQPKYFAFGDRAASFRRWRTERTSLLELEITTLDESLVTRWIGLVQLPSACLLLVLDDGTEAALKKALQIPESTPPESGETTLGHG